LNVSTDLWWFNRIVACGLEGKKQRALSGGVNGIGVEEVGEVFVKEFAKGLGVEETYRIEEHEVNS
jgi:lipoyl(octanoyl) transferase